MKKNRKQQTIALKRFAKMAEAMQQVPDFQKVRLYCEPAHNLFTFFRRRRPIKNWMIVLRYIELENESVFKQLMNPAQTSKALKKIDRKSEHAHDSNDHTHDSSDVVHDNNEHEHDSNDHVHDSNEHAHDSNDHVRDSNEHTHDSNEHAHDRKKHVRVRKKHVRDSNEHQHDRFFPPPPPVLPPPFCSDDETGADKTAARERAKEAMKKMRAVMWRNDKRGLMRIIVR